MTFGTAQKRHLLLRFPNSYIHKFPSKVSVYIKDAMPQVKYKHSSITTIQDYIFKHILGPINKILHGTVAGISNFYLLLDRGAPIAKKLFAHMKRMRTKPMSEPTTAPFVLPHSGEMTNQWEALLANRELTRREVYPLYYRAIMDHCEPLPGQTVFIDGAPTMPLDKMTYMQTKDTAFSTIYFVKTLPFNPVAPVEMSSRDILATPRASGPRTVKGPCPEGQYTHNIVEGDLSAFFHCNNHMRHPGNPTGVDGQDIIIDSNDGDTVLIALLHARDRIDPQTGRFRNRLWVLLKGAAATKKSYKKKMDAAEIAVKKAKTAATLTKANEKLEALKKDPIDGRDIYININKLYLLMDKDPDLSKASYPVLIAVTLYIMSGTDFFGNFTGDEYSLFFYMGWEKHVWNTWCKHASRFSHMIMLFYSGKSTFGQPHLLRKPYIDENNLLAFIYQCYVSAYGVKTKEKYGKLTPKTLEAFSQTFYLNVVRKEGEDDIKYEKRLKMARKKRIPPRYILIRYIRLVYANAFYWINEYRPNGPEAVKALILEVYQGFPYIGFTEDPERPGRYTLSPVCSEAKPAPEYYSMHFDKHNVKNSTQGNNNATANAQITAAKKAKNLRKAERDQRRFKKKQKEDRKREREARDNALPVIPSREERMRRKKLPSLQ